jgi:hypothetical protein
MAGWLTYRGNLYFDVPYNPQWQVMPNRHFRVYDLPALDTLQRASGLVERGRLYTDVNGLNPTWLPPLEQGKPFHYVACWWQRV